MDGHSRVTVANGTNPASSGSTESRSGSRHAVACTTLRSSRSAPGAPRARTCRPASSWTAPTGWRSRGTGSSNTWRPIRRTASWSWGPSGRRSRAMKSATTRGTASWCSVPGARVARNRSARNVNSGILVVSSESSVVSRNVASDHVNPDTGGIVLLVARVPGRGNDLSRNEAAGISLENGTTSTKVVRNRVRGGGDGIIVLDSDENTVVRNGVQGRGRSRDRARRARGRRLGPEHRRRQRRGPERADAVSSWWADPTGTCSARTSPPQRGHRRGSGSRRRNPRGGRTANRLERNVTARNAANGIHLATAGNVLTRNTSFLNRGHGIDAIAGTIDGGGNRAFRNGLSPQCWVSCW